MRHSNCFTPQRPVAPQLWTSIPSTSRSRTLAKGNRKTATRKNSVLRKPAAARGPLHRNGYHRLQESESAGGQRFARRRDARSLRKALPVRRSTSSRTTTRPCRRRGGGEELDEVTAEDLDEITGSLSICRRSGTDYLMQMGEIPLLSRAEEVSPPRKLSDEVRFPHSMMANDSCSAER